MTEHLDELAELYALGSLEADERVRVEQHVAGCAECATRVHEAERSVLLLAEASPMYEPPHALGRRISESVALRPAPRHWWSYALAAAAAFALALIPAWVAVDRSRVATEAMHQDERALARIAAGPFNRADFMSPQRHPMDAKVLYGPHGDWYYVVVMHPKPGMQIAYVHGGRMEMLGHVAMHGESGTLYLPVNHKMDELALLENDTVVADAHLVY